MPRQPVSFLVRQGSMLYARERKLHALLLSSVVLGPAPPAICTWLVAIMAALLRGSLQGYRLLRPIIAAVRGYRKAIRAHSFSVMRLSAAALPQGLCGRAVLGALGWRAGLAVCGCLLPWGVLEGSVGPRVRARQARAADKGHSILNNQDVLLLLLCGAWPTCSSQLCQTMSQARLCTPVMHYCANIGLHYTDGFCSPHGNASLKTELSRGKRDVLSTTSALK